MDTPSVRFYIKYLDNGTAKTVRLNSDKGLVQFAQFCAKNGFAILDTHMVFCDVEMVVPDFQAVANASPIDHSDVSLAKDGERVMGLDVMESDDV